MRRFPIGLTIAASLAFALLVGLGVWQLKRLEWKQDLLARIDALRVAPPRPLEDVLLEAARGRSVEYRRVSADCRPLPGPERTAYRYALRDGQVGWRLISVCGLAGQPYDGVVVDRGLVARFAGAMTPSASAFNAPGQIVGVLRSVGGRPLLGPAETTSAGGSRVFRVVDKAALSAVAADSGVRRPVPYLLAVERETPPPAGVVPAALPQDIPNNHFVYALTWFALAAVLAWFYGALVFRKLKVR